MQKLGNIVIKNTTKKDDALFNYVSDYDKIDNTLPTLIIGLESAQNIISSFTILQKNYDNGMLCWTFNKRERRDEYNWDLKQFKNKAIMLFLSKIKYEYIDFTCYPMYKTKQLIKYLRGKDKKICFITRNSKFVFIYSQKYRCVWGLSLTLCEYLGISKVKVLKQLRENTNNVFINGNFTPNDEIKDIIKYNTHYILPLYGYFSEK